MVEYFADVVFARQLGVPITLPGAQGLPGAGYQAEIVLSRRGFATWRTRAQNAAILSAALDELALLGGGCIVFDRPGTFPLDTVTKAGGQYSNIRFKVTCPGVILDGQEVIADTNDRALIEIEGIELAATTLTASAVKNSRTIVVASVANLPVGRMFYMRSSGEIWGGAGSVSGFAQVRKYEVNYVAAVDENTGTITTRFPLSDSYSTSGFTVSVTPFDPVRNTVVDDGIYLKGGGIKGVFGNGDGQCGIRVRLFEGLMIYALDADGWQNSVVRCRIGNYARVYFGKLKGLLTGMPASNFYGFVFDGVRDVETFGVSGENMRRAVDCGTVYITRYYKEICTHSQSMNGSACGTHIAEHVEVAHCYGDDVENGVSVRFRNGSVHHCRITNVRGDGIGFAGTPAVYPFANMGSVSISHNYIHFADSNTTGSGFSSFLSFDSLKITYNEFDNVPGNGCVASPNFAGDYDVDQNRFNYRTASSGTEGVGLANASSTLTSVGTVRIGRNIHNNAGTRNLVRLRTPTSGVLNKVYVDEQITDSASATQVTLLATGGGTIGTDITLQKATQNVTIAAGVVTAYRGIAALLVETEGNASTDDLDTILAPNARAGDMLVVRANSGLRDVVMKDSTGNMNLAGDFVMDNSADTITLQWSGSQWLEVSRSNNGV